MRYINLKIAFMITIMSAATVTAHAASLEQINNEIEIKGVINGAIVIGKAVQPAPDNPTQDVLDQIFATPSQGIPSPTNDTSEQNVNTTFKTMTFGRKLALSIAFVNGKSNSQTEIKQVVKLTPSKKNPAPLPARSIELVNSWVTTGIADLMIGSDQGDYRFVALNSPYETENIATLHHLLNQTNYVVGLTPASATSIKEWKNVEGLDDSFKVVGMKF